MVSNIGIEHLLLTMKNKAVKLTKHWRNNTFNLFMVLNEKRTLETKSSQHVQISQIESNSKQLSCDSKFKNKDLNLLLTQQEKPQVF